MSLLRRGALGLVLTTCLVAGLAPAGHADNLEADSLLNGAPSIGDVCRGTTYTGGLGFTLKRNGNANSQAWANSTLVTVKPAVSSQVVGGATLTLGQTSATTPSTWTGTGGVNNGAEVDVPDASVRLQVPSNAPTGAGSVVVTYAGAGTSAAGGTATRTTPVSFSWNVVNCMPADTTAPVIAAAVSPSTPDGANGWYRSDVSVDWTVSDPESAPTSTGCEDVALTSDGTRTSSCAATSAGGTSGPVSLTVKRDATPPTLEPVVEGELGEDGWYVGDVAVSWTASDATSGVDGATLCAPASLTTDTTSRTFRCSVSDLAGNGVSASVTVKRDASDPVIVSTVAGSVGDDGWFTSDVDVTWTVTDATSDVATRSGCDDVRVEDDTAGTSFTCAAADHAGNATSSTVSLKRDATAPDVTFTRTGTEGTNGWFRGPVDLAWSTSDGTSGVAHVDGCVDRTITADGRHSYPCAVTDAAGNTSTSRAAVDLDATGPVVTPIVTGPTKGTEWFTGDVSVSWAVSDATSGVVGHPDGDGQGCESVVISTDTAGSTYTCAATDDAGNSTSRSTTVMRDATAPVLTLTGGPADGATYDFGDVPAPATCVASDATSGVDGSCAVTAGTTTVGAGAAQVAKATDRAGNVATLTRRYTVAAWRLDGFYRPVAMGATVVNTVKAGSTVPLKFNVVKGAVAMTGGIGATFAAKKVGCDGSDLASPVEELATTGSTALRYDATGAQWVQNWATPSSGKGSCYRVTMTTADGSSIAADFALK